MSLKLRWEDDLAVLELDHGKVNEMGRAELAALEAICDEVSQASALLTYSRRVTRSGTPIFVAGANVTERVGWSDAEVFEHVRYQRSVLARVRALPLFHIGVVSGVALGWGTEYLLTCDYRIATPAARFGLPETGLGIVPGAGGSSELSSLIGLGQTLRLGMTGEQIGAEEAHRIGLVEEVVSDLDAGLERARALSARVSRRSPTAVAAFKRAALASVGRGYSERSELEAQAYEHCVRAGEAAVGREHFKAIRSGERPPWGEKVLSETS